MTTTPPILFDYWRSSASYRVRIALNLKGVPYEAQPVDLLAGEHRAAAHIARNPQGLAPALQIDGRMLTQSLAIIEYLEDTRPDPAVLPSDPQGRQRVRALCYAIAMEIHPICNLSVTAHVAALTGGGDEAKRAWMRRFIAQGLEAFEAMLDGPETGRFCHGDAPGIAECCLIPQLYNAERWGVDITAWRRITAIARECVTLDAFKAAHPDNIGLRGGGRIQE